MKFHGVSIYLESVYYFMLANWVLIAFISSKETKMALTTS